MARLDAEAAAKVVRPSRIPTAAEARDHLESLPDLWAKTSDAGRHAIAEAMLERIEVLGTKEAIVHPTPEAEAHGWRELGETVLTSGLQRSVWSGREG
ncbi:MAG TPA: hypothetical protein VF763_06470 [Candidatus Limnocylindrales bacterium]